MTVAGRAAAPSSVLWQAGGGAQLRPAAAQSHSVSPGTRPEQHCVAIHPPADTTTPQQQLQQQQSLPRLCAEAGGRCVTSACPRPAPWPGWLPGRSESHKIEASPPLE